MWLFEKPPDFPKAPAPSPTPAGRARGPLCPPPTFTVVRFVGQEHPSEGEVTFRVDFIGLPMTKDVEHLLARSMAI